MFTLASPKILPLDNKKLKILFPFCIVPRLFFTLASPKILSFDNKWKKCFFSLYCSHLIVSLQTWPTNIRKQTNSYNYAYNKAYITIMDAFGAPDGINRLRKSRNGNNRTLGIEDEIFILWRSHHQKTFQLYFRCAARRNHHLSLGRNEGRCNDYGFVQQGGWSRQI